MDCKFSTKAGGTGAPAIKKRLKFVSFKVFNAWPSVGNFFTNHQGSEYTGHIMLEDRRNYFLGSANAGRRGSISGSTEVIPSAGLRKAKNRKSGQGLPRRLPYQILSAGHRICKASKLRWQIPHPFG